MLPLAALALAFAAASAAAPAPGVTTIKERYVSAVEAPEKTRELEQLSRTAPRDVADASALYDLFMRFPQARKAAVESLSLMAPQPALEPLALAALEGPESHSRFFGARLAALARTPAALKVLRKEAARPWAPERLDWWAQLEALEQLALWEGAKALPLLRKRAGERFDVAPIIGRRLWAAAWPDLLRWAASPRPEQRRLARDAAREPIPPEDARATRPAMLAALTDSRLERDFRHPLAIKVGASSDAAEAHELARRAASAASEDERLLWETALFASGQPAAVPALARYAAQDPQEWRRQGAFEQLSRMLGEEKARELVEAQKADKK